jgi:hypothetical protein
MTGAAHTFCVTEYAQTLLHTRKKKTERETTPEEVTIGLCRECKERKEKKKEFWRHFVADGAGFSRLQANANFRQQQKNIIVSKIDE